MKSALFFSCFLVGLAPAVQGQLFSDTFNRTTLPPWTVQSGSWQAINGVLRGGTNGPMTYGFTYITNRYANFSVQAQLQFTPGAYGGGIGGRFDASSGAHYAAWVYPEGSPGGSSVLKLLRFDSHSQFVLLQETYLAAVGTGFHALKIDFSGNAIKVYFDGSMLLSASDSTYGNGSVCVGMWTDASGYQMNVDNVAVEALQLVANDDNYTAVSGTPLIVGAPGVLSNDSGGSSTLSAVLASTTEHGTLTLNSNGSFIYNATDNFCGSDTYTYYASDGQASSAPAAVRISVAAIDPLYSDSFGRPDLAPWTIQSGNWAMTNGTLCGGTNTVLTYGMVYLNNQWRDYSVQASVQLTAGAFGGGIDACLNTKNGARYALWIYPEGTDGGSAVLRLIKFLNWSEWNLMGQATLQAVSTNAHALKLACSGNRLAAYFDGTLRINVTDNDATPYLEGAIGVDFWTDAGGYRLTVDDVLVASLVNDDYYSTCQDTALSVPAPGVLVNDTAVWGVELSTVLLDGPTNGTLSFSSDGGFSYTPETSFVGTNTFSYEVFDGSVSLGPATAVITVSVDGSGTWIFSEHFDGVTAPALPSGWTTVFSDAQSAWVTRTAAKDTLPNAAYVADTNKVGLSELLSPPIFLPPGQTQLRFRNNYHLESNNQNPTNGYDGGVLELKVGNGTFTDILAAGGSFVIGGYNRVIDTRFSNPLAGREAWSGTSGGFTTTLVNLPAAAAGQTIQLRWRCGTDSGGTSGTGWYIDTVSITNNGPKLPAQADRTIPEMTSISIVNTALVPGNPSAILTYAMAVAPMNAVIAPNGVITWTPSEAQGPGEYAFTTVVSDNSTPTATATNTFTVTVTEVNSGPTLTLLPDQSIGEGTSWSINATASDADLPPNMLTYELVSGPDGLTVSPSGLIEWTPAEEQGPGTNTVSVRVFDNGEPSLSVTNSFVVVVNEVNSAPVLALPADQTIGELVAWNATATAIDIDLPPNSLTFELVAGPAGLSVSSDGAIYWTPAEDQGSTTNIVMVRVLDNGTPPESVTNSFVLTVEESNSPPLLTLPASQTINENTPWSGVAEAIDLDLPANSLTFELVSSPAGMTIYPHGLISWTPTENQGPATNLVTVRVFDNGTPSMCATNSFTLTVLEVNGAPVLTLPADQTISERAAWTAKATAIDTDFPSNTLTFELVSGPSGLTVSSGGTISWTPSENQGATTNIVTVRVFDNGAPSLSATNSFLLYVSEVNSAPLLTLPANQAINEKEAWTANATATDTDLPANLLTFELVSGPVGLTISSSGLIRWTPTEAQGPTTYIVIVRVSDDGQPSLSTTNSFVLTVKEVNSVPMLGPPNNQTISELAAWNGNAAAIDPDEPPNHLAFELVSGPRGLTVSPDGLMNWTPSEDQGPGTNIVTLRVFDDGVPVLSATNSFTLIVKEVNSAPVLTLPSERIISKLATWIGKAMATDADLPANTLTFELVSGPSGLTVASDGSIVWTPAEDQGPSTNTVIVRVFDNGSPSLSATDSFTLIVDKVNRPPILTVPADHVIKEMMAWSDYATASDPDSPSDRLTFEMVHGPTGIEIATDGLIYWTPGEEQGPSTNTVTIRVFDDGATSLSATNSFNLIVEEVNASPVLPEQNDRKILELTTLTVTNRATDSDLPANALTYSLLSAPVGAIISGDGVITWTPNEGQGPSTNTFVARVADNGEPSLSVTNTFKVVVDEWNSPPLLPILTNRTIMELTTLTVTNGAIDSDLPANALVYSLLAAPIGASISTNGVIIWTPSEAQGPSTNTFITQVVDNGDPPLSATNVFAVVATESNSVPVLPAQTNRTIMELTTLTVTNAATDPDLPANVLTYSLLAAPSGATISTQGVISWTPTEAQGPSTNSFVIRVVDNGVPSLSAINSFIVVVTESNSAPTLPSQNNRNIDEMTTLMVTNTATDSDLPVQVLSYTLLAGPSGALIRADGIITWTPTEAQGPGTNTFITRVTDNGTPPLSATNSFSITVNERNSSPVLPSQPDWSIMEMTTLTVNNAATDSDLPSNALTYFLLAAPNGAIISPEGVISWTPTEFQGPSTNAFIITVRDDGIPALSATNTFIVVVNESNQAPVLPAQFDRTIMELTTLTVTNTASDSDLPANVLTYSLLAAPNGATISPDGVIAWTPTELQGPSTNAIVTMVRDNGIPSMSATNTFIVEVTESNQAPVLPTQPDRRISELTTLYVTNTATDADLPAQTLTYSLLAAPTGATISADGVITWTPSEMQGSTTNIFTTQVVDSSLPSLQAVNTFTVIVDESNSAPMLPAQNDRTILELDRLTIVDTAVDTDFPANTLSYTLLAAPSGATISAAGVITWTPTEAQGPSTNTFIVYVVDNGLPPLNVTHSFSVVVNESNSAPVMSAQADRVIHANSTLVVTNTATDHDLPVNAVIYALLEGPANFVLDTFTGVANWTPTASQFGVTNLVRIAATDYNPWAVNAQHLSATNSFKVVALTEPKIVLDSTELIGESMEPANNAIEPGETVAMLFSLKNIGGFNTTNLVVTLLQTNAVYPLAASQSYGTIPGGGGTISRLFTFVALGTCGSTMTPTLLLEDSSSSLGTVAASIVVGRPGGIISTQNFDSVTAPTLPAGWTASAMGAQSPWFITNSLSDTAPNAAFSGSANNVGLNELVSPPLTLPPGPVRLSFRNSYDLEYQSARPTNGFDGAVLEIKIGTNVFADILAAGGTFVSGGYNTVISGAYKNPLTNRPAWSGKSGGYITTLVDLPSAASEQTIQLRWCCGTDNGGTSGSGWRIDNIGLTGQACDSTNAPPPVIQFVGMSNGVVTVSWSAIPDVTYRLQCKSSLADANWSDCSSDVRATGPTATATDAVGGATQRFYRVYLVP